jgi:pimeloyl-ACP methyl ester carboxylesterase
MAAKAITMRRVGGVDRMTMGSGPPLVFLPGLAPENCLPVGSMRNGEIGAMARYADRYTVHWIGRPCDMLVGSTFAEMTDAIAEHIRHVFDEPVRVLGISTGGSFAQQLAAEHPELVERLVLVSTGSRLAGHAARTQQTMIRVASWQRARLLMAAFAWDIVPRWRGRTLAASTMFALGPRLYPGAGDLHDLLATLIAEADFDLRELPTITAPTLIINGGKDKFYERAIVDETAALIPGSRSIVYADKGHIGAVSDKRGLRETLRFLA